MKKIILSIITVMSLAFMLCSCAGNVCNICDKKCSDKHSYRDGQVIICNECYKDLFEEKAEVDPSSFIEK